MSGADEGEGRGFLTRWSRLKRAAEQEANTDLQAAPHEDQPVEPAPVDQPALEWPLPSLDDLKPGDSLVAFMQKGVPDVIRNAALRKMWALDPMVRDFRSEALDYAYDWNTPGGVPGTGPLSPNDRFDEIVEAMFSPPTNSELDEKETAPVLAPEAEPLVAEVKTETAQEPEDMPKRQAEETQSAGPPRRRHGGALPQA